MYHDCQEGTESRASLTPRSAQTLRILEKLDDTNARVAGVVNDVLSVTEHEVLACGSVLSAIVDNARLLNDEAATSLASSVAQSEEINARFVKGMQEDILAQTAAVKGVLDLAQEIERAIAGINDLTSHSKILAVNARIEAAWLGEQGKGFAVIADSLSGLSKTIRSASDKVSSAVAAVREGLHPVKKGTESMRERTLLFIEEVGAQVKLASLQTRDGQSNSRLAALVDLSNQALSHLQFQDPVAQKLLLINKDLNAAKESVRRGLIGEDDFEDSQPIERAANDGPLSGEVMLF